MEITFLGIGSNSFGAALSTTSFCIGDGESRVLIDCGPDTPRQLGRFGIRLIDIDTVILTHRHLDHCLGLPYFLFGRNLDALALTRSDPKQIPNPLKIISEGDVWEGIKSLFALCHPDVPKLAYEVEHVDIGPGPDPIAVNASLNVISVAMDHAVPAYGLVFRREDRNVVAYSTDTLPTEKFIEVSKNADVLIHEAMVPAGDQAFSRSAKHSTTSDAGEVVRAIDPGKAFLVHLRPVYLANRSDMEQEASESAGIPCRYPDEGETFKLS